MISELNRKLRKMIMIAGALLIILKLLGGMKDRDSRYETAKKSMDSSQRNSTICGDTECNKRRGKVKEEKKNENTDSDKRDTDDTYRCFLFYKSRTDVPVHGIHRRHNNGDKRRDTFRSISYGKRTAQ